MSSHNKNKTWLANRKPHAEKKGGRTKMVEKVVSERWKFQKKRMKKQELEQRWEKLKS